MRLKHKKLRRLLLMLLVLAGLISGHSVSALSGGESARTHRAFLFGENGYIRPNDPMTRAEAAMAFYQLLDDERRSLFSTSRNDFTDVSPDDWFNTAVSTMNNAGLITGFPDGTFRPDATVTRAAFATIVVRFSGVYVYPSENRFRDTYGHWADNIINTAVEREWMTGLGGVFRPNAAVTRVQAAVMLTRKFDRLPECAYNLPPDMLLWNDNQRAWGRIEYDSPRTIHDPQLVFTQELSQRLVTEAIILHHLDSWQPINIIHSSHLNRGWLGFAYNFQVNQDGTIWRGRGLEYLGAHTNDHNSGTIGIAVQGRFHDYDRYMSNAQFDALIWLIRYINNIYGELPLLAHSDVNRTYCPGQFFPLEEVRRLQFRDMSNVIGYRYGWIAPQYWLYIQAASNSYTTAVTG